MVCVDTSGNWPTRGVFGAISRKWPTVEKKYKNNKDKLSLGTPIAIKVSNDQGSGPLYVSLLVCMKPSGGGKMPELDESSFEEALISVCTSVLTLQKVSIVNCPLQAMDWFKETNTTSLHMSRFSVLTPNLNWDKVERLLAEHCINKGVGVYMCVIKKSSYCL